MTENEKKLENKISSVKQTEMPLPEYDTVTCFKNVGETLKKLIVEYMSKNKYFSQHERNAELFKKCIFDGMKQKEIGIEHGISGTRVGQILKKCRSRMRSKEAKTLREDCVTLLRNIPKEDLTLFVYWEIKKRYSKDFSELLAYFYEQVTNEKISDKIDDIVCPNFKKPKMNIVKHNIYRAGLPWLEEEDEQLENEYECGMKIFEIAKVHQRTVVAIKKRLEKHGHS